MMLSKPRNEAGLAVCNTCKILRLNHDNPSDFKSWAFVSLQEIRERHVHHDCRLCGYLLRALEFVGGQAARDHHHIRLELTKLYRITKWESEYSSIHVLDSCNQRVLLWSMFGMADIYLQNSGLAAPFLKPLQMPAPTSSEETFAFLEDCLSFCGLQHPACEEVNSAFNPKRLVRLEPDNGSGVAFVEDVPDMEASTAVKKYAALSYCWGGDLQAKLTAQTIPVFREGVAFNNLPRVFQDAITVALRFNVSYLWIDALCIIQDDAEEWAHEAAQMASIYSNAYLTIIAASSPNSATSFLSQPRTYHPTVLGPMDDLNHGENLVARKKVLSGIHTPPYSHDVSPTDPTDARAWTLQERLLSRRCLIFSTEEVQFECREHRVCQCSGINPAWESQVEVLNRKVMEVFWTPRSWENIVSAFTKRALTQEGDKLVALAGIAARCAEIAKSRYVAGLWEKYMPECLMWTVTQPVRQRTKCIPDTYRAPSWSWASVEGAVSFDDFAVDHSSCKVMTVNTGAADGNQFGSVATGSLVLKAPMRSAWLKYDTSTKRLDNDDRGGYQLNPDHPAWPTDPDRCSIKWDAHIALTRWTRKSLGPFISQAVLERSNGPSLMTWNMAQVHLLLVGRKEQEFDISFRCLVLSSTNAPIKDYFVRLGALSIRLDLKDGMTKENAIDLVHGTMEERTVVIV